jgi:hypothetical protein
MPRTRYINPKALHDEDIVSMSMTARYVFANLPCFADREGRLIDKPMSIKLDILPNDPVDMDAILNEIAEKKHIIRYEVEGKKYIQIRSFVTYQKPYQNELPSKIPRVGFIPHNPTEVVPEKELGETKGPNDCDSVALITYNSEMVTNKLETKTITKSEPLPSTKFNNNSFALLFGGWPPADDPKYNEPKNRAELAFFENITADNYDAFCEAWDTQLNLFKKDTSKDRRRRLGTFRTFCEGRWMNVENLRSYSDPEEENKKARLNARWD